MFWRAGPIAGFAKLLTGHYSGFVQVILVQAFFILSGDYFRRIQKTSQCLRFSEQGKAGGLKDSGGFGTSRTYPRDAALDAGKPFFGVNPVLVV